MQRSPWFAFLVCLAVGLIASVRADDRPNVVLILADDLGFDEYFGIPYSNDMRPVQVLEGPPSNIKLTTPFDLSVAAAVLSTRPAAHQG